MAALAATFGTAAPARRGGGIALPLLPPERPLGRVPGILAIGAAALFFGVYTEVPMALGTSGTVPMVSALPGLVLLLLWRGTWSLRMPLFVAAATIAFLLLSLASVEHGWEYGERLTAVAQFGVGVALGYVGAVVLMRLGSERLFRIVSLLLPTFCVLLAIEVATPFKQLVTAWLNLYPREYDFINLAVRDSGMGGYRPNLFTSETSYVAMSAVILVTAYLWLGRGLAKYLVALGYTLVLAVLIRSPIVLLSLPILLTTIAADRTAGRMRLLHTGGMLLLAAVGGLGLLLLGSAIIERRLAGVASGSDYSTTYRTYGSLAAGWNVAREYPLLGVGPGSIDKAREIIIDTQIANGVPVRAVMREWKVSINNALGAALLYFGFFGSAVVAAAVAVFVATNVPGSKLPVATALLFLCATYGAIYTPKFVTTFIILVALARLRANVGQRWRSERPMAPARRARF